MGFKGMGKQSEVSMKKEIKLNKFVKCDDCGSKFLGSICVKCKEDTIIKKD